MGSNVCVRVAKWLVLAKSDHKVKGLNAAEGKTQLMTVQCFIVQNLALLLFHHHSMT